MLYFDGICLPQKYMDPLTFMIVNNTARRTCIEAKKLESMRSVVTKMQAKARHMFLYISSMMICNEMKQQFVREAKGKFVEQYVNLQ